MKLDRKIVAGVGVVAVALLDFVGHVDAIRQHLPVRWVMHSQEIIVAILITLCLYLVTTHKDGESGPPGGVSSSSVTTAENSGKIESNPAQTANPMLVASPSITQELHLHPSQPQTSHPIPAPAPKRKHNVKFLGLQKIRTDFGEEYGEDEPEMLPGIKATFYNEPVPGHENSIADFDYAKARLTYTNRLLPPTIATISYPLWLGHSDGKPVHIEANFEKAILLAVFFKDHWVIPYLKMVMSASWAGGEIFSIESRNIDPGVYTVEITVVGANNVALEVVRITLDLFATGEADITQQ